MNDNIFKKIVLRFILIVLKYIDKSYLSGAEMDDLKFSIEKILKINDDNSIYEQEIIYRRKKGL